MSRHEVTATGSCLCGAVRYEVHGPLRDVIACHCEQCRRTSGHFVAATATRPEHLVLNEDKGLRWYRSPSERMRRGFCQYCGSSIFFVPDSGERISIAAGTFDAATGLKLVADIFVEEAGDYYKMSDAARQVQGGDHGIEIPGNKP